MKLQPSLLPQTTGKPKKDSPTVNRGGALDGIANNSEFFSIGRQEEEDGKTLVCDKRDRAITCVFCRDLHLTFMFTGLLQKICSKESEVGRNVISNKILSRLSHKVCRLSLSSPILLREFTIAPQKTRNFTVVCTPPPYKRL